MDLNGVRDSDLILNETVQFALESNVYALIEHTRECKAAKIPLRHGMLLAGTYGTGKTLTAKVIAQKCVTHGWTFVYLEHVKDLAHGLRVAEMFAPAVLFAEDIDSVVGADRDEDLNAILNVLDGIDTKSKAIVTVLTTNKLETIHRSFLRAGRIDTIVQYELPDAATAWRFVKLYARDGAGNPILDADVDPQAVGAAFAGLLPAFIAEAVQKAKRYAMLTGQPLVSQSVLVRAAGEVSRQAAILADPPKLTHERQLVDAVGLFGDAIHQQGAFQRQ